MRNKQETLEAYAPNTITAYNKLWDHYEAWCQKQKVQPFEACADDIAQFLIDFSEGKNLATGRVRKYGTVVLATSAIRFYYREKDLPSPTDSQKVRTTLRAIARKMGTKQRQAKAFTAEMVLTIYKKWMSLNNLTATRNAVMIVIGFSAALRRQEIVNMRVEDIEFIKQNDGSVSGMVITIPKSKTDQGGRGQRIAVPNGTYIQPVRALLSWLQVSGVKNGYVFRTCKRGGQLRHCLDLNKPICNDDVNRVVKQAVRELGIAPSGYSAHSLRAGFITSAAQHNARIDKIMEVSRHRSTDMVAKYIRNENRFADHAGAGFL